MTVIATQPYPYELPPQGGVALLIIDVQRDFLEPGGFGEALGNRVEPLQAIVPTVQWSGHRVVLSAGQRPATKYWLE